MQLCVDTSVVIDWLRRADSQNTLFYQLLSDQHELLLPVVVVAELFSGTGVWQYAGAKARLEGTLAECQVLSLESNIAVLAGRIRVTHKVTLLDALIAATAMENKLQLVTLDVKDFSKIPELTLWSKKFAK